jgi:hypothetical protein
MVLFLMTDYGVTCNHLTRVYDPAGKETCDDEGCPQGMLGKRHGTLRVSPRRSILDHFFILINSMCQKNF